MILERPYEPTQKILVKDGYWNVPAEDRPKGWQTMPVKEPEPGHPAVIPAEQPVGGAQETVAEADPWEEARSVICRALATAKSRIRVPLPPKGTKLHLKARLEEWEETRTFTWRVTQNANSHCLITVLMPHEKADPVEPEAPHGDAPAPDVEIHDPAAEARLAPPAPEPVSLKPLSWIPRTTDADESLLEHAVRFWSLGETDGHQARQHAAAIVVHRHAKAITDRILNDWMQFCGIQDDPDNGALRFELSELWRRLHSEFVNHLSGSVTQQ